MVPRPAFSSQLVYVFANMVAMKALGIIISLLALGIGAAILHWPIDDKQVDRLAEAKA